MTASFDESQDFVATTDDRVLRREELEDLIASDATPARVTFSTQDFSVDGLVQRLNRGAMVVPQFGNADQAFHMPGFQRGFVWSRAQMDRFIESLLLGYPVPGIFLVRQAEDNKMLILDGQQRLVTLQHFYAGLHGGREFALTAVGEEFQGLTYTSLGEGLRNKLDDSYMQATIVVGDEAHDSDDSVFQIFERLNAGGTQLTPHEIRVTLYAGPLMDSIESLNAEDDWRALFGATRSKRLRDHELILRILALYSNSAAYARPLKGFLNKFAKSSRSIDVTLDPRGKLFLRACELLVESTSDAPFRRTGGTQVNTAQAEAVMVAVMEGLEQNRLKEDLGDAIGRLVSDPDFEKHTGRATADKDAVEGRLTRARTVLFE